MAEKRHYDPGSVFEDEGIPDMQEGTPEQQLAVDPQEMPYPTERPAAVEDYGTTATEQRDGESLERRLREEEPDVDVAARQRDETPHSPGDPGGGSGPGWPTAAPGRVGRLISPDLGGPDEEPDAVADELGADGGGYSAEEQAMHFEPEPPLEDHVPDYTEPSGRHA